MTIRAIIFAIASIAYHDISTEPTDCLSPDGQALRAAFRTQDDVFLGRVVSIHPRSDSVLIFNVENQVVLKGIPPKHIEMRLSDGYQERYHIVEPALAEEYLFTLLRDSHKSSPWVHVGRSSMWDPIFLDVNCPRWRTWLLDWSAQVVESQTYLAKYTDIWFTMLSIGTGLSREAVQRRITDVDTEIYQNSNGFWFVSQYSIIVDWLVISVRDEFNVFNYHNSAEAPKNTWLEEDHLLQNLRERRKFPPSTYFSSRERLADHIYSTTGREDLDIRFDLTRAGALSVNVLMEVDRYNNVCELLQVNMVSGETTLSAAKCYVR